MKKILLASLLVPMCAIACDDVAQLYACDEDSHWEFVGCDEDEDFEDEEV